MTSSREQRPNSLRRQILVFVALITFSLIAAAALILALGVSTIERSTWESRQIEVVTNARASVEGLINEIILFINLAGATDSASTLAHVLADSFSDGDAISELTLVRRDGTVTEIRSTGMPILGNTDILADASWYTQAASGYLYLSGLQIDSFNTPYVIVAHALPSGEVLAMRINTTAIVPGLTRISYGDTGTVFIIDRDGQLLAHEDYDLVKSNTRLTNRPEMLNIRAAPRATWTGTYQNFQGQEVLGTGLVIEDTNWMILTEVETWETTSRGRVILAMLLAGGLFGGVALMIAIDQLLRQYIFRPLTRLSEGTAQIIQGNLNTRVPIARPDEIGQLSKQFNIMAENLREGRDRLNHQTEALRQARDEALAASASAHENARLKSEFLSTMSHELRTPLNAIEGFTSIMLHGMGVEVDSKMKGMLERISANSKRLLQLINSFLDLSRIEAGRTEVTYTLLSPTKLIEKWRTLVEAQAEAKQLILEITLAPDFPKQFLGDEDSLTKIVSNLLSNAVKFTAAGKISLSLLWGRETWSIRVQDSGIGIPEHAHDYIFEAFRQVDSSSKRLYGGTGLGLSIVQKTVQTLNGSITLESTLNVGSTFTVTLPVRLPPAESPQALPKVISQISPEPEDTYAQDTAGPTR